MGKGKLPIEEQSRRQRRKVSKENSQEYANDKRAAELGKRGFNEAAVAGMMQIPEHQARRMMKNKHGIVLDNSLL